MKALRWIVCLLLLTLSTCRLFDREVSVTFQEGTEGYVGTADTYILEWGPGNDNNGGGNPYIEITQHTPPNDAKWGLIRFDLTSIPTSAIVKSATLELYLIGLRGGTATKEIDVHKITSDWLEGNGVGDPDGDPAAPGVDWFSRPFLDYTIDARIVGDVINTWYEFDVTVAVRDWVEDGVANYGVALREDSSAGNGTKRFAASENPDPSIRPRLTVVYVD
jgi:hypothetical protein